MTGGIDKVMMEKSVCEHLYSYRGINWCAKLYVEHKGDGFWIEVLVTSSLHGIDKQGPRRGQRHGGEEFG